MIKLSGVHFKASLIGLVGNAVPHSTSKHHLIAAHEVVHDIFQRWHLRNRVNQVEVDLLVHGDLDSDVALDEVDEAFLVESIVLLPRHPLGNLILLSFEKHNLV